MGPLGRVGSVQRHMSGWHPGSDKSGVAAGGEWRDRVPRAFNRIHELQSKRMPG